MDADILHSAPKKMIGNVECPSRRLCPNCGTRIEHKEDCKHMECPACSAEFCFICLSIKQGHGWPCGRWNDPCVPAPVQLPAPDKSNETDNVKDNYDTSADSSSTNSTCTVM